MGLFSSGKIQNYKDNHALKKIQKEASSGKPEAQYTLGMMYLNGKTVELSLENATEWLGRSGRNGNLNAQLTIAKLCEEGKLFSPNLEYAYRWYELASSKNDPTALYKLGCFCVEGIGCDKSVERGLSCLRSASDLHNPDAPYYLAILYYKGIDVTKSFDEMEKWFSVSSKNGMEGVGIKILEIYNTESADGNLEATRRLTDIYENGLFGIEKSPLDALKNYKILADHGDGYGQYRYGSALLSGKILQKDVQSGLGYLEKATAQNNADAQLCLGSYHIESGDSGKGIWLLEKASKAGKIEADCTLGGYYYSIKQWENALRWLIVPAKKGNTDCAYLTAKCYANVGNTEESVKWYMTVLDRLNDTEKFDLVDILEKKFSDYGRSAQVLKTMVDEHPNVINKLIYIYENKINDPRELAEAYTLSGFPDNLVKAGQIYEREFGEYSNAISAYITALTIDPKLESRLNKHIAILYDRKLNDAYAAAEWYEKTLPDQESYHRLVEIYRDELDMPCKAADILCEIGGKDNLRSAAYLYYHTDRYDDAIEIFLELGDRDSLIGAAELYRSHSEPGKAAAIYERMNDLLKAAECYEEDYSYEKAAELYLEYGDHRHSFDTEYKVKAAELYEKTGNYRTAAYIYEKCGGDYELNAAEAYAQAYEYRNAAELYLRYSRTNWNDEETAMKAAEYYEMAGDWYNAENILENQANSNNVDAMKLLAEHYENEYGREKEALKWYRRAAELGDWEAENKVRELGGSDSDSNQGMW